MLIQTQTKGKVINASSGSAIVIQTGQTMLDGIIVNSHTSGVFQLRDGTTYIAGSIVHSSITLAAGERWIPFFGQNFDTGLVLNTSGTINLVVLYR
jgi:hypothetical protein